MTALFRCLNVACGYVYEGRPGPTACQRCGYIWVKWVNYDLFQTNLIGER